MKTRFDAGTDVAMVAASDANRSAEPFTSAEFGALGDTLERDARAGHLFLVHTNADIAGPVDVYIDEPVPDDVKERLTRIEGEYLLAIPSGSLVVDGAEYYRARKPDKRENGVAVPAGDYAVRCYANENDEDDEEARSEAELARIVGKEDVEYYDRVNRLGCLGGLSTLLLFPILAFVIDWRIALGITIVVFVAYFHVRERLVKRSARYTRLGEAITAYRLEHDEPMFVLELRSLSERGTLQGGSVTLP